MPRNGKTNTNPTGSSHGKQPVPKCLTLLNVPQMRFMASQSHLFSNVFYAPLLSSFLRIEKSLKLHKLCNEVVQKYSYKMFFFAAVRYFPVWRSLSAATLDSSPEPYCRNLLASKGFLIILPPQNFPRNV